MVIITAERGQIVARRRREFGRGSDRVRWMDAVLFDRSGNMGVAATEDDDILDRRGLCRHSPCGREIWGCLYNASQFGSFVTKRQIPSGPLKDSSPPSTVCGQISVSHEVKGAKDGADNQSDGREDRRIFQQNRRNPVCHGDGRDRLVCNGEWRHCPPFAMFSSSRGRAGKTV